MQRYLREIKKEFAIFPLIIALLICAIAFFLSMPFSKYINLLFLDKTFSFSTQSVEDFDETMFDVLNSGTVTIASKDFPKYGNLIGNLKIPGTSVDTNLYFGDSDDALNNGVGIYAGSFIPGYGRTILVAGHNNTAFHGLRDVKVGDAVEIKTFYGNYVYKITETKVFDAKDSSAYDLSSHEETLVMYTCYPFDILGITSKRLFVYATPVSGPTIVH